MAIPSRQIGWGTEENLLWEISKQLELLTNVTAKTCANNAPTYKVYTALLTQEGTNAPVASVLENTLGESISYTRNEEGVYTVTTTGIFPQDKTWAVINTPSYDGNGPFALQIGRINNTQCVIHAYQVLNEGFINLIDLGTNSDRTSIEIRVYN